MLDMLQSIAQPLRGHPDLFTLDVGALTLMLRNELWELTTAFMTQAFPELDHMRPHSCPHAMSLSVGSLYNDKVSYANMAFLDRVLSFLRVFSIRGGFEESWRITLTDTHCTESELSIFLNAIQTGNRAFCRSSPKLLRLQSLPLLLCILELASASLDLACMFQLLAAWLPLQSLLQVISAELQLLQIYGLAQKHLAIQLIACQCRLMIKHGAQPWRSARKPEPDRMHVTFALEAGDVAMAELLLTTPTTDSKDVVTSVAAMQRYTFQALHALFSCPRQLSVEEVLRMLSLLAQHGMYVRPEQSEGNQTPLMVACQHGCEAAVRALTGAHVASKRDQARPFPHDVTFLGIMHLHLAMSCRQQQHEPLL
ncbi:hypothetical protein MMC07_000376 [Pseudocyphellaria aurata]|nr:hypothetical protein [Pseudocyphellaria aurata]